MKLSKKKSDELYNAIHEEIMQVRIQIAKNPDVNIPTKRVDEILSKLCYSAPQKAINLFKKDTITTHDLADLDQQRDDYYNRDKLFEHK